MSDDNADVSGSAKTFTQADVDRIVSERIARERAKYADYDELKAAAAEAGKSKSAIERIEAKLDEATKRADKAERETLIRDVAEHFGISVKVARKFEGKTRDELLADGRDTLTEMGIEPDKSKRTKSASEGKSDTAGEGGSVADDAPTSDDSDPGSDPEPAPRSARRPREALRSGAPGTPSTTRDDELDPMKLVANIRRG